MELAAALLTLAAAAFSWARLVRSARKASAVDPGWRAPWRIAAEVAARRARRVHGRTRARVRRVLRRPPRVVTGTAHAGFGTATATARGVVGASGTVEHRVAVLAHRVDDLDAKVDKLDVEIRAAIEAGDRATTVEALGPGWGDVVEVVVVTVAAAVAVIAAL
jgi:hypothetical protein